MLGHRHHPQPMVCPPDLRVDECSFTIIGASAEMTVLQLLSNTFRLLDATGNPDPEQIVQHTTCVTLVITGLQHHRTYTQRHSSTVGQRHGAFHRTRGVDKPPGRSCRSPRRYRARMAVHHPVFRSRPCRISERHERPAVFL